MRLERRKVEVAGEVVLKVLRILPDSASAEMLRELIDMVLVDPDDRALFEFLDDRALFEFLGHRRDKPGEEPAPVTIPRFPILSGRAAAE